MRELGLIYIVAFVYMTLVFILSQRIKRLDIVDVAWGGAFVTIAISSLLLGSRGLLQFIVTTLVLIWGIRLSASILKRLMRSKIEDPRYTEMRKTWKGNNALNAYVRIFIVQVVLALVISAGVVTVNLSPEMGIGAWGITGVFVWLIGFLFETIGDHQLRLHLSDPANRGKLLTSGLWRYTRHPNYFGEAMQWWGISVIALSVPFGWLTIVAPLTITILLLFVSGVPLTEKRFEGRPGWGAYKKRTSVFFPLPPKR